MSRTKNMHLGYVLFLDTKIEMLYQTQPAGIAQA